MHRTEVAVDQSWRHGSEHPERVSEPLGHAVGQAPADQWRTPQDEGSQRVTERQVGVERWLAVRDGQEGEVGVRRHLRQHLQHLQHRLGPGRRDRPAAQAALHRDHAPVHLVDVEDARHRETHAGLVESGLHGVVERPQPFNVRSEAAVPHLDHALLVEGRDDPLHAPADLVRDRESGGPQQCERVGTHPTSCAETPASPGSVSIPCAAPTGAPRRV